MWLQRGPWSYSQAQSASGRQQIQSNIKRQSHYVVENAPELTLQAHKATCFLTCIIALVLRKDFELMLSLILKSYTGSLAAQPCPMLYLHREASARRPLQNIGARPGSSNGKGMMCPRPAFSLLSHWDGFEAQLSSEE